MRCETLNIDLTNLFVNRNTNSKRNKKKFRFVFESLKGNWILGFGNNHQAKHTKSERKLTIVEWLKKQNNNLFDRMNTKSGTKY